MNGSRLASVVTWVAAGIAGAAGVAQVGLLLYIFFSRMTYPFDLEWMEGGMLCHAVRLMEGKPLYAPPSADFISYLYTPFYPVLLAALGKVFGLTYTLGRLISVLSFIGVLALVVRAAWREGGKQGILWGLAAAGLCTASFQHTGAWYDLVRNDSLYLLLVTGSLFLLRYHHGGRLRWLLIASVLAGAAFLTKQTASLFIIYSGIALLVFNWRRLPVHIAVVGIVAGGTVLLWNHMSDGWFWRYTFEMHQGHDLYWERIWPETELKLISFFPAVAGVLGLWVLVAPISWAVERQIPQEDRSLLYWFGIALVGVAVSAVGFATQWASYNAYIPGLVFPSMFVGMVGARLASRWHDGWRRWLSVALGVVVAAALSWQLIDSLYKPGRHVPTERDRQAGRKLIAQLRSVKGPIMMPYHPFYPKLAGKRPGYPQMGINDVTRAGYLLPPDLLQRVSRRYYGAIILDNPPRGRYDFLFAGYKLGRYFRWAEVPHIVTGYSVRPTYLFVPKAPDPVPPDGRRLFGFEDGSFNGWEVTGDAFGDAPAGGPVWDQGPVGPFEGGFLASSYHRGDIGKGTLLSPEFDVDRPYLTYRVGGGNQRDLLKVRLLVEDKEIHAGSGPGSDVMIQRKVDVRQHAGKRMRVELVDRSTFPWGHLLFDDLVLVR